MKNADVEEKPLRECALRCLVENKECTQSECRLHIDYPEDKNCTLIAVGKHGPMTLEQIAKRHHISIVRAKQILDESLAKLKKTLKRKETIYK